jgi:glycine hydroxymethyltransferase
MSDFLFRGSLRDLDPDVYELAQLEAERQYHKLILIPSESTAPNAVLEGLSTRFHNLYAEGYPDDDTRWMTEGELFDYEARLGNFRRYSDPRYYKGTEYANLIEALARRRCAEVFAANGLTADQLYVNVQALSGAPANNAVYNALVSPGETVMGMNLLFGGHLTHGSPANRSGKYYKIVPYTINEATGRIDMDEVERLAREHKPKMIIVGYSSYPWAADFKRFREIADSVGAYLLADMAHVAGLIAAGAYPSPVGIAHIVTFTTHKTLNGPRGAIILTHDGALARRIDRAVFPGEQGGPHVNVFAALATTFKIAATPAYRQLQHQTVKNAARLWKRLDGHGLGIPFGGTESHLLNVDCKSVLGPDGVPLMGDMAARILDLAGIVCNRNTIPGDKSALVPSGIRLGTPWVTQRGFREPEIDQLGDCIAQVLKACRPYKYPGRKGDRYRARIDFESFNEAKLKVRDLAHSAGIDFEPARHGYPHFYFIDDAAPHSGEREARSASPAQASLAPKSAYAAIEVAGGRAAEFLYWATTSDVYALADGQSQATRLYTPKGQVEGAITCHGLRFTLTVPSERATLIATWLRDLSDGFVAPDLTDLHRKLPGPIIVRDPQPADALPLPVGEGGATNVARGEGVDHDKPYFVGMSKWAVSTPQPLPQFNWAEPADPPLKKTRLNEAHRALGAKMVPFAGWEMPVQYTGVLEEHLATRNAAGLFDVSHMGVWDARGKTAAVFLDAVFGNEASALKPGESAYTHLIAPSGHVYDDAYLYCLAADHFLIVVNASNDDKDWAWVNGVHRGEVVVDADRQWAKAPGRNGVTLRNLRAQGGGADQRVDIALQGPKSRDVLLALADAAAAKQIKAMARTNVIRATVGGFDLIVSRTGYTGEQMGFELFVHPDRVVDLWNALLKAGQPFGLKPCGLASRDSLRTEAGLPLYGDELAGHLDLAVGDSGFDSYVKTHKPWFIGRGAFLGHERNRKAEVTRFRFTQKSGRMAHNGDPVLDASGRIIGEVTCCSIDSEGYRLGQALLPFNALAEGTELKIVQGGAEAFAKSRATTQAELEAAISANGGKARAPEAAVVLSKFPKRK